jgi:short-subunit dehydrogenase
MAKNWQKIGKKLAKNWQKNGKKLSFLTRNKAK